ncbi:hypothetical protein [Nostoc sp. ChiSLP03a]|uniref:hypothetical protein n=1 Tax=Nostoc sp. ChiSLP03a TaxID=3075380 RepID=UPI002AD38128|nr:hypothetical protein [Nostoc sp. ChiSLP03a]
MNEFKDLPIFLSFVIFAIGFLNQRKIAQHSVVYRLRYLCKFAGNLKSAKPNPSGCEGWEKGRGAGEQGSRGEVLVSLSPLPLSPLPRLRHESLRLLH